ncbi:hypothetical protein [uncultured phage cr112_1]|uniref:Uncharacterized protein n=1 Tax=uncultured phage cr112_1 TaxID=2772072 RepID=A0A7M1RXT7_9CAUD|nr:hypothetical protein KNV39_gp035 [uncultured phage cr112_1]QOR59255.1 hypothetical protein [uncultured phage cr112_1]
MAHSNGIITAPVGIHNDIPQTLGIGSTDLGTQCTSPNINPFAMYKPVRLATMLGKLEGGYFMIEDTRTSVPYSTDWWRSINGQCGFQMEQVNNVGNPNLPDPVWTYLRPNGNPYPYRAIDFDGYNHNAPKELFTVGYPAKIVLNKGFRMTVNIPQSRDRALCLPDIFNDKTSEGDYIRFVVNLRSPSNPNATYVEREFKITQENNVIQWTDDEVRLGGTVGGKLWMHVYMKDKIGRYRSLRNTENTQTIFEMQYISGDPFILQIRCQAVLRYLVSRPYYLKVMNLTPIINAQNYAGGTLPATKVCMYRYYTDSTDYVRELELWKKDFPETTVSAGDYYTMPGIPFEFEVETYGWDSYVGEKVIFIWWKYDIQEVARLVVTINRMNS